MDPFLGPRIEAAEAGRWLKALFLSGASLLGSGGSPLGGQSPAPVASSDAGPPLFRSPGSTAVLAVATSRWLPSWR